MLTLNLKSDIRLLDGDYRVVGRFGNSYQIKNQSTGGISSATLADIYSRLLEPPVEPARTSPYALDHLTAVEKQEVERWAAHIEEFITGLRPGESTPRPGYEPSLTTQNDRMAKKAAELTAAGEPVTRRTLLRKKEKFVAGGPAALIDGRKGRQSGVFDRADAVVIETMALVYGRQGNKSTVTQARLHDLVRREILLSGANVKMPSTPTFYRYFQYLTKGQYVTGTAVTRRSKGTVRDHTFGAVQRLMPGEEAQIDSTPLDIWVRSKKGIERPVLTVLQDRATRSIIGYSIRLVAAKGYDHALTLASALVPFSARPNNTAQRKLLAMRFPNHPLLPETEQAWHQSRRPFIYPRRIVTDNGRDFLSATFHSACALYGIDVTFSAIHTPTDKPHVERNFQSIGDLFTQSLPGYVGRSTDKRGYRVEDDDLLDVPMLNELFGDWVAKVWQDRPHTGLRDLYDPSITYSPNQWFNATADLVGEPAFPRTIDTFIQLMPTADRTITTTGVQLFNRHFDSDELHTYRGAPSNRPGKRNQWEIRYNPYDVTRIWVRSRENTWIECRWRRLGALYTPHTSDLIQNLPSERDDVAHQFSALAGTPMPDRAAAAPDVRDNEPSDEELQDLYDSDPTEMTLYDYTDDDPTSTPTPTPTPTPTLKEE
jgi:putative transposase